MVKTEFSDNLAVMQLNYQVLKMADVLPQNLVPQSTLTQRFSPSEVLFHYRKLHRVWVRVTVIGLGLGLRLGLGLGFGLGLGLGRAAHRGKI